MAHDFKGFPKDFFAFFRELKSNNDRTWFEENKPRYRESVQAPMSDFITAMAPRLAKISKHFQADPRPNGRSMFRIYRDVRFSKDQRPYKLNAACQFRHERAKDVHAPGFYVHLAADEVYYGGGMYLPEPEALGRIRGAIVEHPAAWQAVKADKKFVAAYGTLSDEHSLTRPPRGYPPEHPLIADLKKKSFFGSHESTVKAAQSPTFADEVAESFRAAASLMKFLCKTQDVAY